ncbi:MAG: hypothetical protein MUE94_01055 [Verrucomicrobia bacterium]|jgi:hypothetical protein|nr:hypothetical protein [Verrucomicrobiota bacterium]
MAKTFAIWSHSGAGWTSSSLIEVKGVRDTATVLRRPSTHVDLSPEQG